MKLSLFVLVLMVGFYLYWEQSEIPRSAGVLAPDEPLGKRLIVRITNLKTKRAQTAV